MMKKLLLFVLLTVYACSAHATSFKSLMYGSAWNANPAEADQGAEGNGRSINAIITDQGSSPATIVLAHTDQDSVTEYTLTTTEVIPSNFHVIIESGAKIIDGGGSADLTIQGTLDCQNGDCFSFTGSGSVTGADASTPYIAADVVVTDAFIAADAVVTTAFGDADAALLEGGMVINDAGADVDFRVESNSLNSALFVDGDTGNIGIGIGVPVEALHIWTNAPSEPIILAHNTNEDANPPMYRLYKDSASPADADKIGRLSFVGVDHLLNDVEYAWIDVISSDVTDAIEDGEFEFYAKSGGADIELLHLGVFGGSTIFNDSGADIDFRIESDANENAFFMEASSGNTSIGGQLTVGASIRCSPSDSGSLGTSSFEFADLYLADGGNIYLGDDHEVIIAHVHDNGINLVGNMGIGEVAPDEMLHLTSSDTEEPVIKIENTTSDANSGSLEFLKNRGATDDDELGAINAKGNNDGVGEITYSQIVLSSSDVSANQEAGAISLSVMVDGSMEDLLTLNGYDGAFPGAGEIIFNDGSENIDLLYKSDTFADALFVNGATGAVTMGSYGAGTATFDASGVISSVSNMNLKSTDGDLADGLDKLLKLRPRFYKFKKESGLDTEQRHLGFYAQEVNEVCPEAGPHIVKENGDEHWGIYDIGLIAILVKAVQEQQLIIEDLKERVERLEGIEALYK